MLLRDVALRDSNLPREEKDRAKKAIRTANKGITATATNRTAY
jgi:hypothetical protein